MRELPRKTVFAGGTCVQLNAIRVSITLSRCLSSSHRIGHCNTPSRRHNRRTIRAKTYTQRIGSFRISLPKHAGVRIRYQMPLNWPLSPAYHCTPLSVSSYSLTASLCQTNSVMSFLLLVRQEHVVTLAWFYLRQLPLLFSKANIAMQTVKQHCKLLQSKKTRVFEKKLWYIFLKG